jgi:spermidine synthase
MALPWETLDTVETPDGPLALRRRGEKDFLLTVRGRVLMTSAAHRSEDELARLACSGLGADKPARVLVSGLGMGFTLRAALDVMGKRARVVVAELNETVATWCKGPLAPLTRGAATDPRVHVVIEDVAKLIASVAKNPKAPRFDAIVLDMYEGPQNRVPRRDPLYGFDAVARTKNTLVPGGIFAIWCEQPSQNFERALKAAGFAFEQKRTGHGGRVHLVYVARSPQAPRDGNAGPVRRPQTSAPRSKKPPRR